MEEVMWYDTYQDTWADGACIKPGKRPCAGRYEAVRKVLSRFKRRFSAVDIGANRGYFGTRMAEDYGACVLSIERNEALRRAAPKHMCIERKVSAADLDELGRSDHFDVVLLMSVLHHIEDWMPWLQSALGLGEHIVIEHPTPADTECKNAHLVAEQHKFIASARQEVLATAASFHGVESSREVSYLYAPKRAICNGAFQGWREVPTTVQAVDSSYTDKTVAKGRVTKRWLHGVNLWSFLQLGGFEPSRERIVEMVRKACKGIPFHGDIRPWNFVLDYDRVYLVDWSGKRWHADDKEALERTVQYILHGHPDAKAQSTVDSGSSESVAPRQDT